MNNPSQPYLLGIAQTYHGLGFNVIPVGQNKRPMIDPNTGMLLEWSRFKDARQTLNELARLPWAEASGVAAICGPISNNLIVVDFDNMTNVDEVDCLLEMLSLPSNYLWVSQTASGRGYHVFLRVAELPEKNKYDRPGLNGGHIELRGHGHYTILPFSRAYYEKEDRWGDYRFLSGEMPIEPPAIVEPKSLLEAYGEITQAPPKIERQPTTFNHSLPTSSLSAYAEAALRDELSILVSTPEGQRNDQLNRSAFSLGQLVGAGYLEQDRVEQELTQAARQNGLPESEIGPTLRSGLEAGKAQPRDIALPQQKLSYPSASHEGLENRPQPVPPVQKDEEFPLLDLADLRRFFENDEYGDSLLFADLYQTRIRYDHTENEWYLWNGNLWLKDSAGIVKVLVSRQVAHQYEQDGRRFLSQAMGEDVSEETKKWAQEVNKIRQERAKKLKKISRVKSVLEYAATELALKDNQWDQRPRLLAVTNGVIELDTQTFRSGRSSDYLRTASPTEWRGIDASAPRWEQFLDEVFAGDRETIEFLQRLLGYAITGQTHEHVLPILIGKGRNGKDTLLETLHAVLGSIAVSISNDVLVSMKSRHSAGQAEAHLYDLMGKRIVWASETDEEVSLNSAQVKKLTGGGTISTRPLYGNQISFQPTHLLMLSTNHMPKMNPNDYALMERLLILRFPFSFVDRPRQPEERQRDPHLREALQAEASGILAWLVRGYAQYQQQGLNPPDSVRLTPDPQDRSDDIEVFLNECCERDSEGETQASVLYQTYATWAAKRGIKVMTQQAFGRKIANLGIEKFRETGGWIYGGVMLC